MENSLVFMLINAPKAINKEPTKITKRELKHNKANLKKNNSYDEDKKDFKEINFSSHYKYDYNESSFKFKKKVQEEEDVVFGDNIHYTYNTNRSKKSKKEACKSLLSQKPNSFTTDSNTITTNNITLISSDSSFSDSGDYDEDFVNNAKNINNEGNFILINNNKLPLHKLSSNENKSDLSYASSISIDNSQSDKFLNVDKKHSSYTENNANKYVAKIIINPMFLQNKVKSKTHNADSDINFMSNNCFLKKLTK